MFLGSVRSNIGPRRFAARHGERFRHKPARPHVAAGHRNGGNHEGVERESNRRGAVGAEHRVVVAAAVSEAPAAPIEGKPGNDDEVQFALPHPVHARGLPDAERSDDEPGAQREPCKAVTPGDRVPRRHRDPPARSAAGGQNRSGGGLARGGEVERHRARGAEGREAHKARRGPLRPGREIARTERGALPAHEAAQVRLADQDGASGARGVLLRASHAAMRRRMVSS